MPKMWWGYEKCNRDNKVWTLWLKYQECDQCTKKKWFKCVKYDQDMKNMIKICKIGLKYKECDKNTNLQKSWHR